MSYSQDRCSRTFLQDDFGGYQFYNEIVEILDLARSKEIKKVEFYLTEFQNEDDTTDVDSTTFICEYTSDTTLSVLKHYSNGRICYFWNYEFFTKYNIYILKSSKTISSHLIEKYKCDDTNKESKQQFRCNAEISSFLDSTIIQIVANSFKYEIKQSDTLYVKSILSDSSIYYLDSNKRCIGMGNSRTIEYLPNNTIRFKSFLKDGVFHSSTQIYKRVDKSNNNYAIKATLQSGFSDDIRKNESSFELDYKLNKELLPVKLEILNSKSHFFKVSGSTMTVIY